MTVVACEGAKSIAYQRARGQRHSASCGAGTTDVRVSWSCSRQTQQGGRGNALHVGGDGLEVGAVPGGNGRLEHAGLWAEVIVPWVVVWQGVAVSLTAQWTDMELEVEVVCTSRLRSHRR